MGKLDQLKAAGANLARESMGGGRAPGLPAGMSNLGGSTMPAHIVGLHKEKGAARIERSRIVPDPDQPRTEFDPEELRRLADSIHKHGQLQPIRVRWVADLERYVILAGERRWRAAEIAGMAELSCIIHEGDLSPEDRLTLQLVENALRSDLQPLEQARAYRRLMDAREWSARQLASELHLAPSTVTRSLVLLGLPAEVQEQVEQGNLSPSAANEVAGLENPADQVAVTEAAVSQKLNRSEVAELAQAVKSRRSAPATRPDPVTIDLGEYTVKITRRKPGVMDSLQALRRAIREVQARDKAGEPEAA